MLKHCLIHSFISANWAESLLVSDFDLSILVIDMVKIKIVIIKSFLSHDFQHPLTSLMKRCRLVARLVQGRLRSLNATLSCRIYCRLGSFSLVTSLVYPNLNVLFFTLSTVFIIPIWSPRYSLAFKCFWYTIIFI